MTNFIGRQKIDINDLVRIGLYRGRELSEEYINKLVFMHPIVEYGLVTRKKAESQSCIKPKLFTESPMLSL